VRRGAGCTAQARAGRGRRPEDGGGGTRGAGAGASGRLQAAARGRRREQALAARVSRRAGAAAAGGPARGRAAGGVGAGSGPAARSEASGAPSLGAGADVARRWPGTELLRKGLGRSSPGQTAATSCVDEQLRHTRDAGQGRTWHRRTRMALRRGKAGASAGPATGEGGVAVQGNDVQSDDV
jgi:hypothetical protein